MSKILIFNKAGKQGLGAGVWNLGAGRDSFGGPPRREVLVLDRLPLLADAGITCVEAHDVELSAAGAPAVKKLLKQCGLKLGMFKQTFALINPNNQLLPDLQLPLCPD